MRGYREPPLEPPENYIIEPCEFCGIFGGKRGIPEGFEEICNEDKRDIENCPRWNPEPIKCVVCGRDLYKGDSDFCKICIKEEEHQRFLENLDEWSKHHYSEPDIDECDICKFRNDCSGET